MLVSVAGSVGEVWKESALVGTPSVGILICSSSVPTSVMVVRLQRPDLLESGETLL